VTSTIRFALALLTLLFLPTSIALAASPYDDIKAEFPASAYIVGIGEAKKSSDDLKDRRTAEVLARLEIAKQIKVQIKSQTIDVMCEGKAGALFPDGQTCRNEFLQIVEESVDLFLEGTRIVRHGERGGMVFAVAVLDRAPAARTAEDKSREAAGQAKASLDKAKAGDGEALKQAKEDYKKALTFEKEREIISGVKTQAKSAFEDLEKELLPANAQAR
jgi:hypothetical protein